MRARNFEEVAKGYTVEMALREADRCLQCADEPCVRGCPVGIDIPAFIQKIGDEALPRRVRHHHRHQPPARGVRPGVPAGVAVRGRVHGRRHARAGRHRTPRALRRRHGARRRLAQRSVHRAARLPRRHRRLGPAGMACAADMAKAGCEVVVYEAFHEPGGVLKYGIPDFRLPNAVVDVEIEKLKELGVRFECNTLVGRLFTVEQMLDRDGLRCRVRRHRRRLPELHGHPGRVAQRRAVGQRAAHALQPDARPRLSRASTRRSSPASASR